jgi:predicted DNA-binding protein
MEVCGMATERLEVRLDPEYRRKLSELAAAHGAPVSEVVRHIIDQAYEDALRLRRVRAARELGRLEVEAVPDPEILSRQLEGTYDSTDLP